jgi:hypothetical protein
MDNPAASWLVRSQSRLEQPAEVFRLIRTDAKVRTVHVLVGFPARDQNAPLSPRFQQRRQRVADATAVGKDQPAFPASRHGRFRGFFATLFGLPLKLIEPIVETLLNSALGIVAQVFESKSPNLDSHALRFVEEPHVSRYRISVPFLDPSVAPEMQAGTIVDPELVYAGRHENALAVAIHFSGGRSSHAL